MSLTWCNGLSLEDWINTIATEDDYLSLHGYCDQWVSSNYKDGDKILSIVSLDENFETNLIHCCLIRHNMYLDVRGSTNSLSDVLKDFEDDLIDEEHVGYRVFDTLEAFYW